MHESARERVGAAGQGRGEALAMPTLNAAGEAAAVRSAVPAAQHWSDCLRPWRPRCLAGRRLAADPAAGRILQAVSCG